MSRLTVSPTEMNRFRKLVSNLVENADYDHGHEEVETKSIGGQKGDFETTNKGRADIKNRHTNPRYGDNALKDVAQLEENVDVGVLDRLQAMLQKAGVSDDDMRSGVNLTPKGMHKVAAALGIAASEVTMLLGSLCTKLRGDEHKQESAFESRYQAVMHEDDERFGYEKDANGNVTVRDSQTGKQTYLQGSQATDLLNRLGQSPEDQQAILSGLGSLMENGHDPEGKMLKNRAAASTQRLADTEKNITKAKEAGDTAKVKELQAKLKMLKADAKAATQRRVSKKKVEESIEPNEFLDEMKQSSGTFNFSWDDAGQHGTGTARYSFQDHDMHVQLMSVRDSKGVRLQPNPAMKAKIEQIAHDFIRDENE